MSLRKHYAIQEKIQKRLRLLLFLLHSSVLSKTRGATDCLQEKQYFDGGPLCQLHPVLTVF